MPTLRALTLLSLAAATLLGCSKPNHEDEPPAPISADVAADTFARQICSGLFACSCDTTINFASESECVAQLSGEFQSSIGHLLAVGATWDDACAGQLAATWADWQCLGPSAAQQQAQFDAQICPIIKGTLAAGAECTRTQLGDNCGTGLTCVSSVCVETTVPVPIGQVCEFDWQELPCEAGSYCDYDSDSGVEICKALPSAGDACNPEDYLCGPSSRDLICGAESAICEPAPGTGAPCFDGYLCAPGNYCDGGKDFTCQAQFELGDGCGADAVCPIDASCIGNVCQADPPAACNLAYFTF